MELDWNEIIKQLLSGSGILAVFLTLYFSSRKTSKADKKTTNRVVDQMELSEVPLRTESHNLEAIGIASKAMSMVEKIEADNREMRIRLTEVEKQLGIIRRAYNSLYWYVQRLIVNWEELREYPDPPKLPEDVYHPEE